MPRHQEPIATLIEIGRLAGERGLLWGTGGNLSLRTAPDRFLVTATGTRLEALSPDDLVVCPVAGGPSVRPPRASSEIQVHRRIYQRRPDVGSVIHLSPPYSTLVACTDLELPLDLNPEAVLYLDAVGRAPYVEPGSDELGQAVAGALGDGAAVLMANHGSVTVGRDAWEAFRRAETLEFLARLVVTARAAGLPLAGIGPAAASALRERYGRG